LKVKLSDIAEDGRQFQIEFVRSSVQCAYASRVGIDRSNVKAAMRKIQCVAALTGPQVEHTARLGVAQYFNAKSAGL
jgi:hypothetical protein